MTVEKNPKATDLDIMFSVHNISSMEFNSERLFKALLTEKWQRECLIIKEYIPPFKREGVSNNPKCVAVFRKFHKDDTKPHYWFLRYSAGPKQGYFWDTYGDDFLYPELALLGISNAPCPLSWSLHD